MIIFKLATVNVEFTEFFATKPEMYRRVTELNDLYCNRIAIVASGKVKLR